MAIEKPDLRNILDVHIKAIEDDELREIMYRLTEYLEDVFEYIDDNL